MSCKTALPSKTQAALGTVCRISLYEEGTASLYKDLFDRLDQIESEMSSTLPSSEISILNELAGKSIVEDFHLSQDTFAVIEEALEIAKITDGAFDPTVAPLVKLWDINGRVNGTCPQDKALPSEEEIRIASSNVDWSAVKLNPENKSISISRPGIQLELGGIAKGYAADQLVLILKERGVKKALIDLGGNIYAYGAKSYEPELKLWRIGIKNPFEIAGQPITVVSCRDKSVVTSGPYERFFEKDGRIYHHILDPKSGYPAESDLASVSIISSNSMLADALSTSCFVLGSEKSCQLLSKMDVEYCLVLKDGKLIQK
ncbi:MAG: FAD:protein FMN transferase [Treponemataceae bacterium]|nr:FAD:protein FMN transferase [Treponemataceae bacterium]